MNKLTSTRTQLPTDYYKLPYCTPAGGPEYDSENLGEFLAGDRIENSPYKLQMKKDQYCEQLCWKNLGRGQAVSRPPTGLAKAIQNEYYNNWIVDNLSAAGKTEDDEKITTRFWQGFPVGFMKDDEAYVYNHVNIELQYHTVWGETDKYRIVRFIVQPFSIAHDYDADTDSKVTLTTAIQSCKPGTTKHTSYDLIKKAGVQPQIASGEGLFTYDVIWNENKSLAWASRWDIYLSMDGTIPPKVHWSSITATTITLTMLIVFGLSCVRHSLLRTNFGLMDTRSIDKWMLLHNDVFRPPRSSTLLLSVACGSGAQVLMTIVGLVILSVLGIVNPARRGTLLMYQIMWFVLNGFTGGYVAAKMHQTLRGTASSMVAIGVIGFYPGFLAIMYTGYALVGLSKGSTATPPFSTVLVLLVLWFGLLAPLSFLGAYVGSGTGIPLPVPTLDPAPSTRAIPPHTFLSSSTSQVYMASILPFAACFVELVAILNNVWFGVYYYGSCSFLFLVLPLVVATIGIQCALLCFLKLQQEDHEWWWSSFLNGATIGPCIFFYSARYLIMLRPSENVTFLIYFGYMAMVSVGVGLAGGFVGLITTLYMNKVLYSLIDVGAMETNATEMVPLQDSPDGPLRNVSEDQYGDQSTHTQYETFQ